MDDVVIYSPFSPDFYHREEKNTFVWFYLLENLCLEENLVDYRREASSTCSIKLIYSVITLLPSVPPKKEEWGVVGD